MTVPPPPGGYQVPGYLYPAAYGDPLVTLPAEGFSGWFGRVGHLLRNNWRQLLAIAAVTYGIPLAVTAVLVAVTQPRFASVTHADGTVSPELSGGSVPLFFAILLGAAVVVGYLTGVAHAAVIWTVTRRAADGSAPLSGALGYGFRVGVRLWGWSLLYGLIVLGGTCACVLPGLYCALAGCLYAPIALYERYQPIGTSFRMVNRNFGAALGRMALLVVIVYGIQLVLTLPGVLITVANPVAGRVVAAIGDLIAAPLPMLLVLGTVVLYAELRARTQPLTTAQLDAELTARLG